MTVIPRSTALSQKAIRSKLLSPSSARTLPPSLFLRTRLLHLSPLNMIGSRKLSTAALRYSNAASRSNLRWHWYSRRRLHHLQALRPISYSAVPKLAFRLLGRTSVAALGVGAGGVGYLSYKVDGELLIRLLDVQKVSIQCSPFLNLNLPRISATSDFSPFRPFKLGHNHLLVPLRIGHWNVFESLRVGCRCLRGDLARSREDPGRSYRQLKGTERMARRDTF